MLTERLHREGRLCRRAVLKSLFAVFAAAVLLLPARTHGQDREFVIVGAAKMSCASWLGAKGARDSHLDMWILGIWTGANALNAQRGFVGESTDARGVLAAVEAQCRADMPLAVYKATLLAYSKMEAERR